MNDYETTISFRTTKLKKTEIKEIIDIINNNKDINEPKKNYKILQEFFLDNYKNDDYFKFKLEEIELKEQIKQLTEDKEYLEYKINKCNAKLKDLENKLTTPERITLNPRLKKAFISFIETCKQYNINDLNLIPNELYTAKATTNGVKKTDLIRLVKNELKHNPNLIIDYPNVKFKFDN